MTYMELEHTESKHGHDGAQPHHQGFLEPVAQEKQQELFTCSELGYVLNKRSRRGMGESAEVYRRGGAQRLHGMDEREDIIRESKRGRYSEHGNKENFTDSLEYRHSSQDKLPQVHGTNRRRYSGDGLPQMRGSDSTDGEKHGRLMRSSPSHNFSKAHAGSYNGGRLIKDDSRKMAYRRRDSDASFRQRKPHYAAGRDNFLSRNSPRPGYQTTFKESHKSSRWKFNDDKFHMEKSKSLSWNGPKWGEETTVEDASNSSTWMPDKSLPWNGPKWGEETIKAAPNSSTWPKWGEETIEAAPNSSTWPKWGEETIEAAPNSSTWNVPKWGEATTVEDASISSKWRSDDLNHASDKETGNIVPWTGPKWGEETNLEANSSQCRSVAGNQDYIVETKNGVPCTDSKQGDEAHTEDEPSSRRSTTTKQGSNETKISSSRDDGLTAKDVPSSLNRKRSYDSGRDNFLSRNSAWSGDRTTFNESRWSSKRKSNDDKFHMEMNKSLTWNGPKWGEETTVEDASMPANSLPWNGPKWGEETIKDSPNSSKWRSDDLNHACDKETGNSFPLSGPKWGEETNPKANSSQCKSVADNQDYNGETKNGLSCNDSKQGDEAHTENEPSSRRSTTTMRGSNKTKISSSWDDGATAKDVPSSLNRKRSYDSGRDNFLSRNSAWSGDRITFNESRWSSKRKSNDDKFHMEMNKSLTWNGPKWGEETTVEDASMPANSLPWNGPKWGEETIKDSPNSSKWRSDDLNHACDKVSGNSFPLSGPKWGEETNPKANSSQCKSVADNQDYNGETKNGLSCNDSKQGDEVHTENEPSSRRSTTTTRGSNKTKISSSWDDGATAKDVPSLQRRSDANSWKGPKWGDTQTKDASSSAGWKADANREISNVETKWGYQKTTKSLPKYSRCRLDDDKQSNNVETQKSCWTGPKWDDRGTTKDDDKQSNNVETQKSSWTGPKWDDHGTTENDDKQSNNVQTQKSSWNGPKWGSNEKLDNSLSWKGPKWGDKQTKDASSSSGWKANANREVLNVETKWGYQTTTKSMHNSSRCRLDDDKQSNNVETQQSSWNGPKWDDHGTTEDAPKSARWGSDGDKRDNSVKTGGSSLNSLKLGERSNTKDQTPKWGGESTTKDALSLYQRRSDANLLGSSEKTDRKSSWHGPKWGADVKTDNSLSWHGPKWGDEPNIKDAPSSGRSLAEWGSKAPNNSSSLTGQKQDDKATDDAPGSPKWKLDADKRGSNEKLDDSLSWKGPRWGDKQTKDASSSAGWKENANREVSIVETKWGSQTTTKSMPNSSCCRLDGDKQSNNVETKKSSWNGPKWDDHGTTEDAPKSKYFYDKESEKTSWNDSQWGDLIAAKDAPEPFRHSSNDGKQEYHLNSGNSFPLDAPNTGVQIITCVSPNFSRQSLDNKMDHGVKADSLSKNHLDSGDQTVTQEAYKIDFPSDDQNITRETSGKDQHVLKLLRSPSSIFNLSEQKGLEAQSLNNGEQSPFASRHGDLNQQMEHSISTDGQHTIPKLPSNGQGLKSDWHGDSVGSSKLSQLPVNLKSQAAEKSLVSPSGAEGSGIDGDTRNLEINKEDEKGIQMFKFALVEFVKNVIKPYWKEGHLTKEAHKTIVKKSVDKVMGALHVADIPRTQKNIDIYISFAKIKLNTLVLTYLARYVQS